MVANSISIPVSGGDEGTLVGSLDGPLLSLVGEDMIKIGRLMQGIDGEDPVQRVYCDDDVTTSK